MKSGRIETGAIGEEAATIYLQRKGYRIITRNYRCSLGELDIIAEKEQVLVLVEVKCRRGLDFGHPGEGISRSKRQKLLQLASFYLLESGRKDQVCRFDVVAVILDPGTREIKDIELIVDAFSA
ncbi:MAG TPA: YraN family protein [Firmicutes bacterium]|nr:YraN family protein [Bacillota bacterium]